MQDYPWQADLWQKLKGNLERQHIPGAMLIQAKIGLGPEALVERYVAGLMCQNDASEPCGFCHACSLIASDSHPDVHFVKPEKDKKNLSVEQIRQANKWALESSQFGGYRLIILPQAERMNVSAANALLKTLEEPPSNCVFILTTEHAQRLLPTIRSRCEVWHLSAPSQAQSVDWVSAQLGKRISLRIAYLCQSEPLAIKSFVEQGREKELDTLLSAFLSAVTNRNADVTAFMNVFLKSDVPFDEQLSWLWLVLASAQKQSLGLDQGEMIPEAAQLASFYSYQSLFKQSESLGELKKQLSESSGLNAELLVTNWLYSFLTA